MKIHIIELLSFLITVIFICLQWDNKKMVFLFPILIAVLNGVIFRNSILDMILYACMFYFLVLAISALLYVQAHF